ncbi:TPA: CHAD domain-containing protein [Pseudomonas aeruginosa]|nr:CHAD domain-containing protein [Pseudomonas aeruginosa]
MAFSESVIRAVLGLEVDVMHAYARIISDTDPEALHDLRIAVRRLRSLLKPLQLVELAVELDSAAAALGEATNPVRDMEVMAVELERHGLLVQASIRKQAVRKWCRQAEDCSEINRFLKAIDDWPASFRQAIAEGRVDNLKATATKRIRLQLKRLLLALEAPDHDRHDIRLKVKRARYSLDAYPGLCSLPATTRSALKELQTVLGDWHDYHQWCLMAQEQADLRLLISDWCVARTAALAQAEDLMARFAKQLCKSIK